MNSDTSYITGVVAYIIPSAIIAKNFFDDRHDLGTAIVCFSLFFLVGLFAVVIGIQSHNNALKRCEREIQQLKEKYEADVQKERERNEEYRDKNRELLTRIEELSLADAGKLKLENEWLSKELTETEEKYYKQSDEYMQALDEIIDLKQERDAGLWQTASNEEDDDAEL